MTPDGAPVPHQTLHGSARRVRRHYFRCTCGYLRGRNARFPCSCGAPPASWGAAKVREHAREQRRLRRFLADQRMCICACGVIRYAAEACACGIG